MSKPITLFVSALLAATLLVAGCSDDGDDSADAATTTTEAPTTTTAAGGSSRASYCTDIEAAFGDFQPGFDAIFEENPEPTLDDWAEFLPAPLAQFDAAIERAEAVAVPDDDPELSAVVDTLFAALHTVSDNFQASIDAAEAGDQAEFDRLEDKNQNTDLPAMQEAFADGEAMCGPAQD